MQRIAPLRQRRLQQVGRIHRAAAGRAGADHGVDLVDEQHRVRQLLQLGHDRLQPLLEIAAIARAGQQRAHVERIDHRVLQHFGHVALDDLARQAFGDRGLADAGIADIERVVLRAAAQDLDGAVDLRPAADQRIDLAVLRLLVEIDAIGRRASSPCFAMFSACAVVVGAAGAARPSVRPRPLPMPWLM